MGKVNIKKERLKKSTYKNAKTNSINIENYRHFNVLGLGIVILLGILIYSNSFDCTFQFDDTPNIVLNSSIRNSISFEKIWNHNDHFRFIPYLTFAINYHFDKLNVWGYHFFNLIIHLINSCLVWWLTILLFSTPILKNHPISKHKKLMAIITALLFVSHPLATQSVTYIVQRITSLAAMFYFLSIALYLKGRLVEKEYQSKYIFFAGVFISTGLSFLSKENAYTLPMTILIVEIFFFHIRKFSVLFKDFRIVLLIFTFLCFFLFIFYDLSIFKPIPSNEITDFRIITPINYLLSQFHVILKYIQLLLLPINLNFDYDFELSNNFFETKTIVCFSILLLLILLTFILYNKARIVSFGILYFFVTLSIESSIIPISDLIFEHRTYIPSFGFFIILSFIVTKYLWNKFKVIAICIFALIIISNSFLTFQRNKVWKDGLTLWNDVISKSPNKARPKYNRGVILNDEKKYKQAFDDFTKAIELQPTYKQAYNNRGHLFEMENKHSQALNDYNLAIELDSNFVDVYYNRGNSYMNVNRNDEALHDFNKVIELKPNYAEAYLNRGMVYYREMKNEEAIMNYTKAIELKFDYHIAYYNRGLAEFPLGRKEFACADWEKAVRLGYQPANEMLIKYCK